MSLPRPPFCSQPMLDSGGTSDVPRSTPSYRKSLSKGLTPIRSFMAGYAFSGTTALASGSAGFLFFNPLANDRTVFVTSFGAQIGEAYSTATIAGLWCRYSDVGSGVGSTSLAQQQDCNYDSAPPSGLLFYSGSWTLGNAPTRISTVPLARQEFNLTGVGVGLGTGRVFPVSSPLCIPPGTGLGITASPGAGGTFSGVCCLMWNE